MSFHSKAVLLCLGTFLPGQGERAELGTEAQSAPAHEAQAAGRAAYRAGEFERARDAFAAAERSLAGDAPPTLLHDLALSALRAGDLVAAETAALRLAQDTRSPHAPRAEFLLGNIAFARAAALAEFARQPEAEPFVLEAALAQCKRAREAWIRAASSRADWPAARRNVERALLLLEELQRLADAARREQPEPPPEPEEEPQEEQLEPLEEQPAPEELLPELGAAELADLFERLARKEREKLELRRARRAERNSALERDW